MGDYRRWWTIGGGLLGVALLGVASYNYCRCYCGAPTRLTLSAGNICPLRHEMAKRIAASISGDVEVTVCDSSNSTAICTAVDAGQLDLGLVLGGLPTAEFKNVRQVATLGVEPLHLLVRTELLEEATGQSLELLRGRRVVLGERGANGTRLAEDLVKLAGLSNDAKAEAFDFTPVYISESALLEQVEMRQAAPPAEKGASQADLPDAVFVVDSMPSELVDRLVEDGEYGIVPLPFATALHLESRRSRADGRDHLRKDRVEAVSIPAYAYGIQPAMPVSDCETIGLRLLLVANQNVSNEALLDALRSLSDAVATHTRVSLDVTNASPEFPVHPAAEAFLRARRPLELDKILGPTTDALSVVGASIAGCLALWGFIRGLRAVQPDVHLRQVNRIERLLNGSELDESCPTIPRELLAYLEARLSQVKHDAIDDYASGRLDGDEALVGILTLIADTRHLLALRRKQLGECEPSAGPFVKRQSAA
jgi:TRAP-type uncharacterized transport system substrate-binding protein